MALVRIGARLYNIGGQLAGYGGGAATAPAAVAPGQVGALAAGAPGNYTIPVSYSAAAGTATISYAGRVALHGSTSFTPNNGTFSATGGQFVGLSAGTAYDLQIVATNTAGSSTTTLLNITTGSAPVVFVPSAPTATANRADLILDQAIVAPGSTVTGGLYPNGNWNGGTATIAGQTITLPSSGNAKVPVSFTAGAAGEMLYGVTNTANLRNPSPAPLTVFSSSSGSVGTLTLGSLPGNYRNQRTFQQSVWAGSPGGFQKISGASFTNGWGKIKVPFASSAPAVFARLTDADTGTIISNIAQVYGPVSNGTTATLLLPASDYCINLDLATDAAFTNPTRFPIKFFIRDVILVVTRSAENMLWGSYAPGLPGNTNWSSYVKTTGLGSQNPGGGAETDGGAWGRADGSHGFGQYGQTYGGVGGQELGRMFAARKGTGVGILGLVAVGGNMDTFWAADGSPCGSVQALMAECDGEARYLVYESDGLGLDSASITVDEYRRRHRAIPGKMTSLYPSLAVISGNGDSGQWGPWGSALNGAGDDPGQKIGHGRQNQCVREVELLDPCVTAADAGADWNKYYSNSFHADWGSAIRYSRARARSLLLAEQPVAGGYGRAYADRYITMAPTGTLSNNEIFVSYTLPAGATTMVAKRWSNNVSGAAGWVYTTPTEAELLALVALYQGAGKSYTGNSDVLVQPTYMRIDTAAKGIRIGVPSGTVGPITMQFLEDYYRTVTEDQSFWVGLFDDRDLGDGCGYGPGVRSQLDIAVS